MTMTTRGGAVPLEQTTSGLPAFLALVVRGTWPDTTALGLIKQLMQDFSVCSVVDLESVNSSPISCLPTLIASADKPQVSRGGCQGLREILSLKDTIANNTTLGLNASTTEVTLVEFLRAFYEKHPLTPLVVTGQSLGGSQTEMLAAWLLDNFNKTTIYAHQMAPSTPGNTAWVKRYSTALANRSVTYINSMDLVPFSYWAMGNVSSLYGSYGGPEPPFLVQAIIKVIQLCILGKSYAHPERLVVLSGPLFANYTAPGNYLNQVAAQHLPPGYMYLFCQYLVDTNISVNYPLDVYWRHFHAEQGCYSLPKLPSGAYVPSVPYWPLEPDPTGTVTLTTATASASATVVPTATATTLSSSKPNQGSRRLQLRLVVNLLGPLLVSFIVMLAL